jgi:hypothetical protein
MNKMSQAIVDKINVWREIKPNSYAEFTIPRSDVRVGDVVYDRVNDAFGRILEIVMKEPGNYTDMSFEVKPEPNFFVFNRISLN